MSDNTPGEHDDQLLRDLVAQAAADAPPPPDPSEFLTPSSTASLDRHRHRRRWIAGGGAVGLTAAATIGLLVANLGDDGADSVILPATPSTVDGDSIDDDASVPTTIAAPSPTTTLAPAPTTSLAPAAAPGSGDEPTADTTVPPTTIGSDEPSGELPFGFTPLLPWDLENDGYRLDFAVSSDSGVDGALNGHVRYSHVDPTRPSIGIVLGEDLAGTPVPPSATTHDVGGRQFVDVSAGGSCSADGCTLFSEWDPNTAVTIGYVSPADGLPAGGDLDGLLEAAGALQTFELGAGAPLFRPVAAPFAPTIHQRGVITADAAGVSARTPGGDAQVLTTELASRAVGLSDGRVLIASGGSARVGPDDLSVWSPATATTTPFWIDGVPDDGSHLIEPLDVAIVDGRQLLLALVIDGNCDYPNPDARCDGTLQVAEIETIAGVLATGPTVVDEFGNVFERVVDLDLMDGGDSLPAISGIVTDLVIAEPYFRSLDGTTAPIDLSTDFEASYSESDIKIRTSDGYLVSHLDGEITVFDFVGDFETTISLDGILQPNAAGVTSGISALEPALQRALPAHGSIWVRAFDPAVGASVWLEIDLDGEVIDRIVVDDGDRFLSGSLTIANG